MPLVRAQTLRRIELPNRNTQPPGRLGIAPTYLGYTARNNCRKSCLLTPGPRMTRSSSLSVPCGTGCRLALRTGKRCLGTRNNVSSTLTAMINCCRPCTRHRPDLPGMSGMRNSSQGLSAFEPLPWLSECPLDDKNLSSFVHQIILPPASRRHPRKGIR